MASNPDDIPATEAVVQDVQGCARSRWRAAFLVEVNTLKTLPLLYGIVDEQTLRQRIEEALCFSFDAGAEVKSKPEVKMKVSDRKKETAREWGFKEKVYAGLLVAGCVLMIAGGISDWYWQGMFDMLYGVTGEEPGTAVQESDSVTVSEYDMLKPLIILVMHSIPWSFYALGGGAFLLGFIGFFLGKIFNVTNRIFSKQKEKQNISQ